MQLPSAQPSTTIRTRRQMKPSQLETNLQNSKNPATDITSITQRLVPRLPALLKKSEFNTIKETMTPIESYFNKLPNSPKKAAVAQAIRESHQQLAAAIIDKLKATSSSTRSTQSSNAAIPKDPTIETMQQHHYLFKDTTLGRFIVAKYVTDRQQTDASYTAPPSLYSADMVGAQEGPLFAASAALYPQGLFSAASATHQTALPLALVDGIKPSSGSREVPPIQQEPTSLALADYFSESILAGTLQDPVPEHLTAAIKEVLPAKIQAKIKKERAWVIHLLKTSATGSPQSDTQPQWKTQFAGFERELGTGLCQALRQTQITPDSQLLQLAMSVAEKVGDHTQFIDDISDNGLMHLIGQAADPSIKNLVTHNNQWKFAIGQRLKTMESQVQKAKLNAIFNSEMELFEARDWVQKGVHLHVGFHTKFMISPRILSPYLKENFIKKGNDEEKKFCQTVDTFCKNPTAENAPNIHVLAAEAERLSHQRNNPRELKVRIKLIQGIAKKLKEPNADTHTTIYLGLKPVDIRRYLTTSHNAAIREFKEKERAWPHTLDNVIHILNQAASTELNELQKERAHSKEPFAQAAIANWNTPLAAHLTHFTDTMTAIQNSLERRDIPAVRKNLQEGLITVGEALRELKKTASKSALTERFLKTAKIYQRLDKDIVAMVEDAQEDHPNGQAFLDIPIGENKILRTAPLSSQQRALEATKKELQSPHINTLGKHLSFAKKYIAERDKTVAKLSQDNPRARVIRQMFEDYKTAINGDTQNPETLKSLLTNPNGKNKDTAFNRLKSARDNISLLLMNFKEGNKEGNKKSNASQNRKVYAITNELISSIDDLQKAMITAQKLTPQTNKEQRLAHLREALITMSEPVREDGLASAPTGPASQKDQTFFMHPPRETNAFNPPKVSPTFARRINNAKESLEKMGLYYNPSAPWETYKDNHEKQTLLIAHIYSKPTLKSALDEDNIANFKKAVLALPDSDKTTFEMLHTMAKSDKTTFEMLHTMAKNASTKKDETVFISIFQTIQKQKISINDTAKKNLLAHTTAIARALTTPISVPTDPFQRALFLELGLIMEVPTPSEESDASLARLYPYRPLTTSLIEDLTLSGKTNAANPRVIGCMGTAFAAASLLPSSDIRITQLCEASRTWGDALQHVEWTDPVTDQDARRLTNSKSAYQDAYALYERLLLERSPLAKTLGGTLFKLFDNIKAGAENLGAPRNSGAAASSPTPPAPANPTASNVSTAGAPTPPAETFGAIFGGKGENTTITCWLEAAIYSAAYDPQHTLMKKLGEVQDLDTNTALNNAFSKTYATATALNPSDILRAIRSSREKKDALSKKLPVLRQLFAFLESVIDNTGDRVSGITKLNTAVQRHYFNSGIEQQDPISFLETLSADLDMLLGEKRTYTMAETQMVQETAAWHEGEAQEATHKLRSRRVKLTGEASPRAGRITTTSKTIPIHLTLMHDLPPGKITTDHLITDAGSDEFIEGENHTPTTQVITQKKTEYKATLVSDLPNECHIQVHRAISAQVTLEGAPHFYPPVAEGQPYINLPATVGGKRHNGNITGGRKISVKYNISQIIAHSGYSAGGGHYVCYFQPDPENKPQDWYIKTQNGHAATKLARGYEEVQAALGQGDLTYTYMGVRAPIPGESQQKPLRHSHSHQAPRQPYDYDDDYIPAPPVSGRSI